QRAAAATLSALDVVIAYDTLATLQAQPLTPVTSARSSLSAALGRYVRVRDSLLLGADRLRVEVASPFAAAGIDVATRAIRAMIPDSIGTLPVTIAPDTVAPRGAIVVHATGDDAIAATVQLLGDTVAPNRTVLERGAEVSAADTRLADAGATVVHWPARSTRAAATLQGLTMQRTTWIAPFERDTSVPPPAGAEPVGWWADGTPAVWQSRTGRGCLVTVRAALPDAGDHALSLSAQAFVRALVTACDVPSREVSAAPAWLAAPPSRVTEAAVPVLSSGIAPWLLGAAIALALGELALRAVRPS
ncbi:MAG TPA: hypothetical protein VE861_14250, partial [Gemmatimonadaceae bacterium]|nr:hypothetical protein [Gemmatimonadaceae bacterium]